MENFSGITKNILQHRGRYHDLSKFSTNEFQAYLLLHYNYEKKNTCQLSKDYYQTIQQGLNHHHQHNSHHPEAHQNVNNMPLIDLIEMVCDWTAIAEENDHYSCYEWARKNLTKKWDFSTAKINQIYDIIYQLDSKKQLMELS